MRVVFLCWKDAFSRCLFQGLVVDSSVGCWSVAGPSWYLSLLTVWDRSCLFEEIFWDLYFSFHGISPLWDPGSTLCMGSRRQWSILEITGERRRKRNSSLSPFSKKHHYQRSCLPFVKLYNTETSMTQEEAKVKWTNIDGKWTELSALSIINS